MHSFLFISTDQTRIDPHIQTMYEKHAISPFAIHNVKKEKGSIGIEDIRKVQKDILLTPAKGTWKAVCMYQADTMTIDAQNAFLKTLEEPPPHTLLILCAENKDALLPTVQSRCFITVLSERITLPQSPVDISILTNPQVAVSKLLKTAEKLSKTRENALSWITDAQVTLREQLIQTQDTKIAKTLTAMQKTYTILKTTNANPRIVLEHFFLSQKSLI